MLNLNPYIVVGILPIFVVVILSFILMYHLASVGRRIHLVDRPDNRKRHTDSVPLVGGISIAIAVSLSAMLAPFGLAEFRYLFFCLGVLIVVGVLDDAQDTSPGIRFLAQFGVAAILVFWDGTIVTNIGDIFSWNDGNRQGLGSLAYPLTVLAIVGVINGFNMIDGHDGIAGLMTGLTFFGLAIMCYLAGELNYLRLLLVIGSAITVFLIFNLPLLTSPKHQVFMGDAGAMFLGLLVAFFLIRMTQQQVPVIKPTVAIWFIGLPLLDMMVVIVRRLVRRKTLTSADRTHIHHLLMKVGLSKWSIIVVLGLTQAGFIFIGIVGHIQEISDQVLFWTPFAVLLVYMVLLSVIERRGKHIVTS